MFVRINCHRSIGESMKVKWEFNHLYFLYRLDFHNIANNVAYGHYGLMFKITRDSFKIECLAHIK